MTLNEANAEVEYLFELFPRTQQAQLDWWRDRFLQNHPKRVREAVKACYPAEYLNSERLNAMLDIPASDVRYERILKVRAEAEQRQKDRETEARAVEASFAGVNLMLSDRTDEQLEDLKRRVIDAQAIFNPVVAKGLRGADIKTTRLLRSLMADLLKRDAEQEQ